MAKLKKRDDGRYQKSVIVGKKPNGKYIKKSVYGKTQKELEANIHALTNEINSGVAVWQNDITFSQLAKIWMEQYHPMESEKWKYREQTVINSHLLPTLGSMHARDLRQIHLQSIISSLATQGYATGTMKKIKQTAVRIMQVAVESDLIVKNPFSGIKVPYVEPETRRALTEGESAQRFLGHTDVEVTLSIYTHLTKFKEEQAIQKLDEHIREKKNEPEKRLLRVL